MSPYDEAYESEEQRIANAEIAARLEVMKTEQAVCILDWWETKSFAMDCETELYKRALHQLLKTYGSTTTAATISKELAEIPVGPVAPPRPSVWRRLRRWFR